MSLDTVLGSRLKRWLLDYASDGTWTCELGSGNTDQPTAGQRPSVDTLTSGQTYPLFDDSDDCLDIDRISTSVIPTWASTQRFLFCFLMKANSGQAQGWILGLDTHSNFISGVSGKVNFADASSNSDLRDNTWHTIIVVKNGTGALTIYVDGSAQTDTGTANWGNDWRTSLDWRLGARQDDSLPFGGGLASMAWAFSEDTDFDSTDIANVHDALVEIRDGGGGGETPVEGSIAAAGALTATLVGKVGKVGAIAAAGQATATATGIRGRVAAIVAAMVAVATVLAVRGITAVTTAAGAATAAIVGLLGKLGLISAGGQATAQLTGTVGSVTPVTGAIAAAGALSATLSGTVIAGVTGSIAASGALSASLAGTVEQAAPVTVRSGGISLSLGLRL